MNMRTRDKSPPDGGYGWVVLAACAFCQGTVTSMTRISGLIIVEIIDTYHVNRTQAFFMLVMRRFFKFVFAPGIGKLLTIFHYRVILCTGSLLFSLSLILTSFSTGYWQLLVTYGCLQGFATNCVVGACSLTAGLYFQERRSLAMSLYYGSAGIIGFISPMLFQWLLDVYEFHGAILILGGISLHGFACGMLVRQPTWAIYTSFDEQEEELSEKEVLDKTSTNDVNETTLFSTKFNSKNGFKKYMEDCEDRCVHFEEKKSEGNQVNSMVKTLCRDLRLFKDGHFLLQIFSFALIAVTSTYFLSLLPDYVESEFEQRVSKQDVAFILSVSSIGEIIMRFGIGFLLDKLPWRKMSSLAITAIIMGITVFTFYFMENYTHLLTGIVFFSLWTGISVVVQYLVEMENMGPERIHVASGLNRFTVGFVIVFAGLLIGYLRDQLGSYKMCIFILSGSSILGGLVWSTEPMVIKCFPLQKGSGQQTKRRNWHRSTSIQLE